jgi:chromosome segregation ATPase
MKELSKAVKDLQTLLESLSALKVRADEVENLQAAASQARADVLEARTTLSATLKQIKDAEDEVRTIEAEIRRVRAVLAEAQDQHREVNTKLAAMRAQFA